MIEYSSLSVYRKTAIQAKFERDLLWKSSWPRLILAIIASLEIPLGFMIFLTEMLNILMDVWHSNVFGGLWASTILFVNWILIFVTVCCNSSVRASTISYFWHLITLIAFGLLIMFDTIFILNPKTCLLTLTCSSQPEMISLNFLMRQVPQFSNYTNYDSKKFFLQIQLICASIVFFFTCTYIFIFLRCQTKLHERLRRDNSDYATSSSSSSSNDDSPPKFSMSSVTDRNSYAYYF